MTNHPSNHLQLFVYRFQGLAEDYLRRVKWVYIGVLDNIDHLLDTIHDVCSKEQHDRRTPAVFDEVGFCREILHFFDPVQCCQKMLWNSDTLMSHILAHKTTGGRDEIDEGTKRLAILFNLYVQIGVNILVRYANNYEGVEQITTELLRKAADYLDCIREKPLRRDAFAADTFTQGTFAKWKLVFDYTCATCSQTGEDYGIEDAIAWFKIHQTTLVANPIRHLGTKVHAANLRNCCVVPKSMPARHPESLLEVNNNPQWSEAAKYLLEVQEQELDKACSKASEIQQDTKIGDIGRYLKAELDPLLGNVFVEPFGSRIFGVANPDSDLDFKISSDTDEKMALKTAVTWSDKSKDVEFFKKIPAGPMLLTVIFPKMNMTLDLTFGSPYAVANSKLLEYFFRLQPMARKLFFLLKKWKELSNFSINFHQHVLIIMIIFYMQQEKYLPPIVALLDGPVMLTNNTFNRNFIEAKTTFPKPTNLLTLAKNFFCFWSQFNWTKNGACVSDGQVRPRESFRIESGRKSIPSMMASDYFEQSRNAAANISARDHRKFIQACKEAIAMLQIKTTI